VALEARGPTIGGDFGIRRCNPPSDGPQRPSEPSVYYLLITILVMNAFPVSCHFTPQDVVDLELRTAHEFSSGQPVAKSNIVSTNTSSGGSASVRVTY